MLQLSYNKQKILKKKRTRKKQSLNAFASASTISTAPPPGSAPSVTPPALESAFGEQQGPSLVWTALSQGNIFGVLKQAVTLKGDWGFPLLHTPSRMDRCTLGRPRRTALPSCSNYIWGKHQQEPSAQAFSWYSCVHFPLLDFLLLFSKWMTFLCYSFWHARRECYWAKLMFK